MNFVTVVSFDDAVNFTAPVQSVSSRAILTSGVGGREMLIGALLREQLTFSASVPMTVVGPVIPETVTVVQLPVGAVGAKVGPVGVKLRLIVVGTNPTAQRENLALPSHEATQLPEASTDRHVMVTLLSCTQICSKRHFD